MGYSVTRNRDRSSEQVHAFLFFALARLSLEAMSKADLNLLPGHVRFQNHQAMTWIEHLIQAGTKEIEGIDHGDYCHPSEINAIGLFIGGFMLLEMLYFIIISMTYGFFMGDEVRNRPGLTRLITFQIPVEVFVQAIGFQIDQPDCIVHGITQQV